MKHYLIQFYSANASTVNLSILSDITPQVRDSILKEGFRIDAVDYKLNQIHFVKNI